MIHRMLLTAALALLPEAALAAEEEPAADPPAAEAPNAEPSSQAGAGAGEIDTTLDVHRTPVEALMERMIGSASRAVRFDWRKSTVGVGLIGSELLERNNFGSNRLGALVRRPLGNLMGEVALTRVLTWRTESSDTLALTPYRQHGRPPRFELDVNVGLPLAEGVATAWPSFLPATELVLFANAGLRYLFYPGALEGAGVGEVASQLFAPRLSERELENLERSRLPGMQVDSARYGLLAGVSLDVYLQPGLFLSPRAMLALPLLSPANGTALGWWWELSAGAGWTF